MMMMMIQYTNAWSLSSYFHCVFIGFYFLLTFSVIFLCIVCTVYRLSSFMANKLHHRPISIGYYSLFKPLVSLSFYRARCTSDRPSASRGLTIDIHVTVGLCRPSVRLRQLVSKISNICDHNPPTSQTHRRTDFLGN